MEAETALVRTDCAVELDTVAQVGLDLTIIVDPGNPECEDAIRLDKPLDDLRLLELGMLVIDVLNRLKNLLYRLEILHLCWILGLETGHNFCGFHDQLLQKI